MACNTTVSPARLPADSFLQTPLSLVTAGFVAMSSVDRGIKASQVTVARNRSVV